MKFPLMLLSFGGPKIFSYDRNNNNYLPLFTDFELAHKWQLMMREHFKIDLTAYMCQNHKGLCDILTLVSTIDSGITVVVDPPIAGLSASSVSIVGESFSIAELLETLNGTNVAEHS